MSNRSPTLAQVNALVAPPLAIAELITLEDDDQHSNASTVSSAPSPSSADSSRPSSTRPTTPDSGATSDSESPSPSSSQDELKPDVPPFSTEQTLQKIVQTIFTLERRKKLSDARQRMKQLLEASDRKRNWFTAEQVRLGQLPDCLPDTPLIGLDEDFIRYIVIKDANDVECSDVICGKDAQGGRHFMIIMDHDVKAKRIRAKLMHLYSKLGLQARPGEERIHCGLFEIEVPGRLSWNESYHGLNTPKLLYNGGGFNEKTVINLTSSEWIHYSDISEYFYVCSLSPDAMIGLFEVEKQMQAHGIPLDRHIAKTKVNNDIVPEWLVDLNAAEKSTNDVPDRGVAFKDHPWSQSTLNRQFDCAPITEVNGLSGLMANGEASSGNNEINANGSDETRQNGPDVMPRNPAKTHLTDLAATMKVGENASTDHPREHKIQQGPEDSLTQSDQVEANSADKTGGTASMQTDTKIQGANDSQLPPMNVQSGHEHGDSARRADRNNRSPAVTPVAGPGYGAILRAGSGSGGRGGEDGGGGRRPRAVGRPNGDSLLRPSPSTTRVGTKRPFIDRYVPDARRRKH